MKANSMVCNNSITGGVVSTVADSSALLSSSGDSDELVGEYKSEGKRRVRKLKRVNGNRVKKQGKRHQHEESEEGSRQMIKEYLCKLQEIVPFSKKSKRLSKLEVITNAIDYIRELRTTLGLPPCHTGGMEEFDHLLLLPALSKSHEIFSPTTHHNGNHDLVTMDISISSSSDRTCENSHGSLLQLRNPHETEWGKQTPSWTVDVAHSSSSCNIESSSLLSPMISSSTSSVSDKVLNNEH